MRAARTGLSRWACPLVAIAIAAAPLSDVVWGADKPFVYPKARKGDVVEIRPKARDFVMLQWNLDVLDRTPPAWLEPGENYQMVVRELPVREQIDVPVREQLIVELYSK